MERGQVSIFVILGVFIVGALLLFGWLSMGGNSRVEERECFENSDCVPNECCDARQCVPENEAPDCLGVYCPPGCKNYDDNSLGCNVVSTPGVDERGSCVCNADGICEPSWPS